MDAGANAMQRALRMKLLEYAEANRDDSIIYEHEKNKVLDS